MTLFERRPLLCMPRWTVASPTRWPGTLPNLASSALIGAERAGLAARARGPVAAHSALVRDGADGDAECVVRCGAITADGTKCRNPVRQGRWCHHHPGGTSSYRPSATSTRSRSRSPAPRSQARARTTHVARPTLSNPPPAQRRDAVKQRQLLAQAERYSIKLGPEWCTAVFDHVPTAVLDGLSVEDCAGLALTAARLLRKGRQPRHRRPGARGFLSDLLGGPSMEESIAAAIADGLPLPQQQSAIAAARALQALGIALCRRAGRPPVRCPCFVDPASNELANVLALLIRSAAGDWSGLVIPFAPLGPS